MNLCEAKQETAQLLSVSYQSTYNFKYLQWFMESQITPQTTGQIFNSNFHPLYASSWFSRTPTGFGILVSANNKLAAERQNKNEKCIFVKARCMCIYMCVTHQTDWHINENYHFYIVANKFRSWRQLKSLINFEHNKTLVINTSVSGAFCHVDKFWQC